MFSMSDSRSIGPGSLALAGALCCVLGQNTLLSQSQLSLHRRKQGYQQTVRKLVDGMLLGRGGVHAMD